MKRNNRKLSKNKIKKMLLEKNCKFAGRVLNQDGERVWEVIDMTGAKKLFETLREVYYYAQ